MTIPLQTARSRNLETDGLLVGGLLLGIAATIHVLVFPDPLATEAIELSVTAGLSLVLVYSGHWLRTNDVDVETVRSLLQWTVAGAAATGLTFTWFLVHQWLAGGGVDEPIFVILSSASGGAVVGFVAGVRNVGGFDSWTGQHARSADDWRESTETTSPDGSERQLTLDELFDVLGTRRSRCTLYCLRRAEDGVATVDEVADRVVRWEAASNEATRSDGDSVRADLHHVVVPKLATVGLLDYDARSLTIRYWSHPIVDHWLARTAPHDLSDEPV